MLEKPQDEWVFPATDLTVPEGIKKLSGFDIIAIEDYFKTGFENLSGVRQVIVAIWANENRGSVGHKRVTWDRVLGLDNDQLSTYFAKAEADPGKAQGSESTPETLPHSVEPTRDSPSTHIAL